MANTPGTEGEANGADGVRDAPPRAIPGAVMRLWLVLTLAATLLGCTTEAAKSKNCESCTKTDDCDGLLKCVQNVCVVNGCTPSGGGGCRNCY